MHRRLLLGFVGLLVALTVGFSGPAFAQPQAPAAPPADTTLDLFLLVGQSNMAGRGKLEAEDKIADPHVWTLDASDSWAAAVDPIHTDPRGGKNGVGLGRTFGIRVAAARAGTQVGLIPCAVGGVSIDQWKKGGKLYTEAVRRAKIAQKRGRIVGILWHQGESDTKPEKIAKYAAKLDAIVAAFRADLDAPNAPLVVGELGLFNDPAKNAARTAFNEMIAKYAADRPGTGLVQSDDLASVGDDTHFDAASQRELGRRYAEAFLKRTEPATPDPK